MPPSAGETIYNLVVPRACLEIVNPKGGVRRGLKMQKKTRHFYRLTPKYS